MKKSEKIYVGSRLHRKFRTLVSIEVLIHLASSHFKPFGDLRLWLFKKWGKMIGCARTRYFHIGAIMTIYWPSITTQIAAPKQQYKRNNKPHVLPLLHQRLEISCAHIQRPNNCLWPINCGAIMLMAAANRHYGRRDFIIGARREKEKEISALFAEPGCRFPAAN
jgi:hypothetical protein